MVYEKEELEKMALSDLRIIGRKIGVKNATGLRKSDLIQGICMVSSGLIPPHKSSSGRPAIKRISVSALEQEDELNKTNLKVKSEKDMQRIEKNIDKFLVDLKQLILSLIK